MSGPQSVQGRQNVAFKVTDGIGAAGEKYLKPCVKEMLTVKNFAQSLLGCVWFVQGLPRAIRLLPTNAEDAATLFQSLGIALKPFEHVLTAAKRLGNVLEFPERLETFKKIKPEWQTNKLKAVYRLTSTFYIALDAVFLIPLKVGFYNLLAIGGWAAKLGITASGLGMVKDIFTAGSSAINVAAEGVEIKHAKQTLVTCQKRLNKDGALAKLKHTLDKDITPESLKLIQELKAEHWAQQFGAKKKKAKIATEIAVKAEFEKLTKQKSELLAKKAKMGNFVDVASKQPKQASMKEIAKLDVELQALENKIGDKAEKLERIKVWSETTTVADVEKLRKLVAYKIDKNQITIANKEMDIARSSIARWYDGFKCAVVTLSILIELAVAAALASAFGAPVATMGAIFFLGQWITGLGTGLSGLCRAVHLIRYPRDKELALPKSHLLRA